MFGLYMKCLDCVMICIYLMNYFTLFSSWVFFRAMTHVLLYALLLYSHLLDFYLVSRWHRGVPSL